MIRVVTISRRAYSGATSLGQAVARAFLSRPLSFLHWMGLDEYPVLAWMALGALDTVETRADLKALFVALVRYAHRWQGWAVHYFPWGAGALFPRADIRR